MVVKTDLCAFSGLRIYPGHGLRYVPATSVQTTRPVFPFIHKKARALFQRRRNPRVISWSQLYRRQHKKGNVELLKKSRKKKVQRTDQRGFAGASIDFINAQRRQTEEQRKQIRLSTKKALEERKTKLNAKKNEQKKKLEEAKLSGKKPAAKTAQQKIVPKKQSQPKAKFTQTR
ncbi:ribosomal protein L24 [Acrasis kona]|uniref:Ribosomal protein L24 n=1 Tax=Acrasis kona TaxID=1008807 RepID=A0AAW2YTN4_9EUKA